MIYFIVFTTLGILAILYYFLAKRYNIIDKPNHRSSHAKDTIRGGGIIFLFATLLFFIIHEFQYSYFLIGLILISFLSFIDDLKPLSPLLRLVAQLFSVLLVLFELHLNYSILQMFFFLFLGVGFINAYNFMDGINGITGLYSISVLIPLLFINIFIFHFINEDLIIYLLFSLIIFGYFNFRKSALFFAGDVGSISIAMSLLFIVLKLYLDISSPIIILLVAVYGVDVVLTLIKRLYFKENLTEAHRRHLYQKIVDSKKYTHIQTSLGYSLIQLFISMIVLFFLESTIYFQIILIAVVLSFLSIGYIKLYNHFQNSLN